MQKLLILYRLIIILIISYSIKVWCDDYDDPEDIFWSSGELFDVKQITTNFLCSIAIQSHVPKWETPKIYKPYVKEALRRGLNQQKCAKTAGRF